MQTKKVYADVWAFSDEILKVPFDFNTTLCLRNRLWVDMKNSQFCFGDCYLHCKWKKCTINGTTNSTVITIIPDDYNEKIILERTSKPFFWFAKKDSDASVVGRAEIFRLLLRYIVDCAKDRYSWNFDYEAELKRVERRGKILDAVDNILMIGMYADVLVDHSFDEFVSSFENDFDLEGDCSVGSWIDSYGIERPLPTFREDPDFWNEVVRKMGRNKCHRYIKKWLAMKIRGY